MAALLRRHAATRLGASGAALAAGALTLVVDAGVALRACDGEQGFELLGDDDLVAPPLLWSEVLSVVHEALWRQEIDDRHAMRLLERMEDSPIRSRAPRNLRRQAWDIAEQLGWAKTYDAEYVALAQLLGGRLVTLDARLRRGADRLGLVVTPDEL